MRRRRATAARPGWLRGAALAAVLPLAACSGGPTPANRTSTPAPTAASVDVPADVAARPAIAAADAGYRTLLVDVESALHDAVGLAPGTGWKVVDEPCLGVAPGAGVVRVYSRPALAGPVRKADWARAERATDAVLRPRGYPAKQVVAGVPDDRLLRWTNGAGAVVEVGTGVRTLVRVTSACHRTG